MTDDEDDKETWRKTRGPSDSDRRMHAAQWDSSHKGVVRGEFEDEDSNTSPIDLFDRTPKDAEERIIRHLRNDPKRLIEYVGKIASKTEQLSKEFRRRVVHESSENQRQLDELRDLLNRPPNGAMTKLQDRAEKAEARIAALEGTIKSAKGTMWKAAATVAVTIAGSAVAIITSWQASAERAGAATERANNDRSRIDRLERISDERSRAPRRDYDYDIAPRPAPLKKDP